MTGCIKSPTQIPTRQTNTLDIRDASGMGSNVLKSRPLLPGGEMGFTSLSMDSLEPVSQPGPQSWLVPLLPSSWMHPHFCMCVFVSVCVHVCAVRVFTQYVSVSAVSVCLKAPHLLCDFCTSNRGEPIYSAIHKPHGDTSPPSPHLCSRGSGDVGCSPVPPALCQSLVPYTGRY